MDNRTDLTRLWPMAAGIVLLLVGVLGFVPDQSIVSEDHDALLHTDTLHDIVHLATGALALYIAFGVAGTRDRGNWLLGFGALYAVIFLTMIVSPDMFGMMAAPANGPLHAIHGLLAVVSLAVGYLARNAAEHRAAHA